MNAFDLYVLDSKIKLFLKLYAAVHQTSKSQNKNSSKVCDTITGCNVMYCDVFVTTKTIISSCCPHFNWFSCDYLSVLQLCIALHSAIHYLRCNVPGPSVP